METDTNQIDVREQLERFIQPEKWSDPLADLRRLLSYPFINFVSQYFTRTREFEAGLDFVECCYDIMWQHSEEITKSEAVFWDRYLTGLRLALYDSLNMWPEYIDGYADMISRYPDLDTPLRRDRLHIIERKQEKYSTGKKIDGQLRYQAYELAPEERERRQREMMVLFARMCRPPWQPCTETTVPAKRDR